MGLGEEGRRPQEEKGEENFQGNLACHDMEKEDMYGKAIMTTVHSIFIIHKHKIIHVNSSSALSGRAEQQQPQRI